MSRTKEAAFTTGFPKTPLKNFAKSSSVRAVSGIPHKDLGNPSESRLPPGDSWPLALVEMPAILVTSLLISLINLKDFNFFLTLNLHRRAQELLRGLHGCVSGGSAPAERATPGHEANEKH